MFAIYNIEGRRFRDSLENMRKVQKTQATEGMKFQTDVSQDETLPIQGAASGRSAESTISSEALQAYQQTRHINKREPIYQAHQLMSHPVSTVRTDMDIVTAKQYFQQQGYQQMPVINAQQRLVGMLSVQDLLQYIIIDGDQVQYLRDKRVADAMSQEVITVDPASDIRRVAQVMYEYHLHGIPVVDEQDALIGIVSRSDILRAVTHDPPLNMWS